ncbi:MAG TPA: AbrB/MazE/SpoVT family DNA-binding domain-containing protein [Kurthia gibsonii]|nr:AbrB/MazE/SpoVT family DNA-binding domain-containing protein [Kurthia gibsonii]
MKSTGIVRKVDGLGRIVLPKELRNVLKIYEGTPLEILVEDERIIVQKFVSSKACVITGVVSDDNIEVSGKYFSKQALGSVAKALQESEVE